MNNSLINNQINEAIDINIQTSEIDYSIIPSRSSLKNREIEQIQHDRIIMSIKTFIQKLINIVILLLSLPILLSDISIISYYHTNTTNGTCISKIINLSNGHNRTFNINIQFSLITYLTMDIFLSLIILSIVYYLINIAYKELFCFTKYKNIINISRYFIVLQVIWIILGILTIIDKELVNVCKTNIYTFTYINIVTRGMLLIILTSIVINNYYIL